MTELPTSGLPQLNATSSAEDPAVDSEYAQITSGHGRKAAFGAVWSSINSFAPGMIGMAVFMVSSRYLHPVEFGLIAFANSITSFANAFAPAGFGDALVQRKELVKKHLDAVFWLCLGSAILIYLILVGAAWPISMLLNEKELAVLLPVVGLKVIFDLSNCVPSAILSRTMSFRAMAIRTTAASVVAAVLCIGILLMGFGIWALALSQLASSIVSFAGTILSVKWRPGFDFDRSKIKELAHFGVFASASRMLTMLNLDQILIGSLIGTLGLGLVSFSTRITKLIADLIPGPIGTVAYPLMASLQDDQAKGKKLFLDLTFATNAIVLPAFAGIALVSNELIPLLFGEHWRTAISIVQLYCVVGIFDSLLPLQSAVIRGHGKAKWWMWYNIFDRAAVALTVLFSFKFGIMVFSYGLLAKSIIFSPALLVFAFKLIDMKLKDYLTAVSAPLIGVASMVVAVAVASYVCGDLNAIWKLLIEIGAGALIYSAVMSVFARNRLMSLVEFARRRK